MMQYSEFIEIAEDKFGPLSETQKGQFRALEALYREWNSKINVISRKDMDELYLHHVLHSLAIAAWVKAFLPELYASATQPQAAAGQGSSGEAAPESLLGAALEAPAPDAVVPVSSVDLPAAPEILDLGTGGGFPGIPLAILFPGAKFTLCDSVGKKTTVASAVARAIGLDNVTVINARAEDLPQSFDYIVSRAVTSLDKFIPWVRKKYRKGIIYLKGGDVAEEISKMMSQFKMRKGSVHTWHIDSWLSDPWFEGKLVIFIENICN